MTGYFYYHPTNFYNILLFNSISKTLFQIIWKEITRSDVLKLNKVKKWFNIDILASEESLLKVKTWLKKFLWQTTKASNFIYVLNFLKLANWINLIVARYKIELKRYTKLTWEFSVNLKLEQLLMNILHNYIFLMSCDINF